MKTMSISRRIAALLVLAFCGTVLTAASTDAASTTTLAGKWTGRYGGAVSGHFTIHWKQTGSRLHGNITLSRPSGTYSIGGSVQNGKIKFGAVSVGAKYKGKVRGTSMSGTWTSPQGGGSWSATKVSGGTQKIRVPLQERSVASASSSVGPARQMVAAGQASGPCPAPPTTKPGAAVRYPSIAVPTQSERVASSAPAAMPKTAAKFAQSVLAKRVIPPHAKLTTKLRGAIQVQSAALTPGIKGFTDLHRVYAVNLPVARVVAFEQSHIPSGTHLIGTGMNCLGGTNSSFQLLSVPVSGVHEFYATLTIGMQGVAPATTLLRFDAQTSWVPRRPASEAPPKGAALKLTVFNASPAAGNFTESLSTQQEQQVTSELNSLPLAPATQCAQSAPIYELQYTGAPSSFQATGYRCGGTVLINGNGKAESPLRDQSYRLIRLLSTFVPRGISLTPSNGTSTNWAGWADPIPPSPHLYQTVAASWTVPKVSCNPGEMSSAVEWVGLDGDGNSTVEQDGTSTQCILGTGTYGAWWELFGSNIAGGFQMNLPGYDHVNPGDRMTASVIAGQGSGGPGYTMPAPPDGGYLFSITDSTQHWSWFSIEGPGFNNPHPAQTSVEWITEQNSCFWVCQSLAPYGSVTYTGMRVGDNTFAFPFGSLVAPGSVPGGGELDLVSGGILKESGSPLGPGGDSETTTWHHR